MADATADPENGLGRCVRAVLALEPDLDATSIAEAVWLAATDAVTSQERLPAREAVTRELPPGHSEDQVIPGRMRLDPPAPLLADRGEYPDEDASAGITPLVAGRRALVSQARHGPQPPDLSRALRPFKRHWPDGRKLQLDVDETVRSYARTWKLVPKFRPAPERWFAVDIVIDDSPSMTVWGDMISVLSTLLRQLGAFSTIRTWRISVTGPVPLLHHEGGQPAGTGQLRSPGGRRLIILVSDGSAAGWFRPESWELVRGWAGSTPTALISPLATRLWGRTGLGLPTVRVGPGSPGSGNAQLQFMVPRHQLSSVGEPGADRGWLPLPVSTLTPHMLGRWARMLMKADPQGCDALLMPPVRHPPEPDAEDAADPAAAGARLVNAFCRAASPEASRLAALCAPFSSVSLELLELLSAELIPEASTADLAEVIVGGLFRPATARPGAPSSELLRFRPGVRERLRELLPETDAWRAYEALIKHVTEGSGADATFAARVPDPLGDIAIPADLLPLAAASREALEFLDALPTPWRDEPMITVTRPGASPAVLGNVPARDQRFTGRDRFLDELPGLWQDERGDPGAGGRVALSGPAGVGKTAIAAEYAHRHSADYDVIWWVQADRRELAVAALAALAARLRLAEAESAADVAARAARDTLGRGEPFRRWLLIFDHAARPSDLEDLIPLGPGHILITSTQDGWQDTAFLAPVGPFTRSESMQFLRTRIPQPVDSEAANQLALELGDLPLALKQASGLIARTQMPVPEYLDRLQHEVRELRMDGAGPGIPLSLTAALTMALSELNRLAPEAIELLYHLVFLDAEQVSVALLRAGASELGFHPDALAQALRTLASFALLSYIGDDTVSVPQLVRALVRDELLDPPREPYPERVHLMLAAVAPGDPADPVQWARYGELLRHLNASGLRESPDRRVRDFALNVLQYLRLSGDLAGCRSLAQQLTEKWSGTSGPHNPLVLQAQLQLAAAFRLSGGYAEAGRITDLAYRNARSGLGEQAEVTTALRVALAQDLRLRGDFTGALALDSESREVLAATYGSDDPQATRAASDVGLGLLLTSRYSEARDLLAGVFSELVEGVTPAAEVAATWTRLSWAARLCGDYATARKSARDAWEYARARLGPRHQATIRAATALAIALRRLGPATLDEARDLAGQVHAESAAALGPRHPDTLAALVTLANCERELGSAEEALRLTAQARSGYEASYGDDHPVTRGCLGATGLLRRLTGSPMGARDVDEQALSGLYSRLTPDHHYSLSVAINLASDLAAVGDHHQARVLGEDALRRSRALLGGDHPVALGCAVNLATDLQEDDDPDYASRLYSDTMRRYVRALGGDHPDTKTALAGERVNFDFDPPPL